MNKTDVANQVSQKTGVAEKTDFALEDCEKVLTTLEETLDTGLADKFNIFKHSK